MVQLTLPKGSQVKKGKAWPGPTTKNGKKPKRTKDFRIYRYNPDEDGNPTWIPTASIWTAAGRWFWTHSSRSRTRSIRP